jgi:hypothetical protein
MTELGSLLGVAAVLLTTVVLSSVLGRLVLEVLRFHQPERAEEAGNAQYLLLVGPVLGPLLWGLVTSLHHLVTFGRIGAVAKGGEPYSADIALLVASLGLPLLVGAAYVLRYGTDRGARPLDPIVGGPTHERLSRVIFGDVAFDGLRLFLLPGDDRTLRTTGRLFPRVLIGEGLVHSLPEDAIRAALLHEREHIAAWDPIWRLILATCMSLNPASYLLERDAEHWRFGRELGCDRDAVASGADAIGLASALLASARPGIESDLVLSPALAQGGLEPLMLRVQRLLEYAESRPGRGSSDLPLFFGLVLVVSIAVVPRIVELWPLADLIHRLGR